jgi:hypothetical protein
MTSPTFSLKKIGVNGRPLQLGRKREAGQRGFSGSRVFPGNGCVVDRTKTATPWSKTDAFSQPKTPVSKPTGLGTQSHPSLNRDCASGAAAQASL